MTVVQKIFEKEVTMPFSKEKCIEVIPLLTKQGKPGEPDFYISKYKLNPQSNPALNIYIIEFGIRLTMATVEFSLNSIDENSTLLKMRAVSASPDLTEGVMRFINVFVAMCEGKNYKVASNEVKEKGGSGAGCMLLVCSIIIPVTIMLVYLL